MTYSANSISELTNDKVQEIIDNFSKQEDDSPTSEISAGGSCQNSIIVKTNQTDASEAQERSLVYSATPATHTITMMRQMIGVHHTRMMIGDIT
ncbi:unnamed protein product [Rhizophagus irregularis]|nr:unnamed protein product [Rhizophagus irregularis]